MVQWFQRLGSGVRTLLFGISLLYTVLFLAWRIALLSPLYDRFWQLQFSEVITAWAFLPLLLLLPPALILRTPKLLVVLLLPFFFFAKDYGRQFLPNWQLALQPIQSESKLRVLTWNTLEAGNRDGSLTRVIAKNQPDLIALQEVADGLRPKLFEQFGEEYPYQQSGLAGSSLLFLSKYPFRQSEADYVYLRVCSCHQITLDLNGQAVTLINLHLPGPQRWVSGYGRLLPQVRAYSNKNQESKRIILQKIIDDVEGPLLLLGDFNTTESQRAYRQLLGDLTDSFAEVGWGMGFTFPSPYIRHGFPRVFPLIRIDHVLHSDEWIAQRAWTGNGGSSDHRYLVVDLALREDD